MHYYEVAPNQIIRATSAYFTYTSSRVLQPGHIVLIEIGSKKLPGVVLRSVKKPPYETKEIISILETTPLPVPLLQTALWLSSYYATHVATVIQSLLPRGLQKKRRASELTPPPPTFTSRTSLVFTSDQVQAISTIKKTPAGTILLHGATGSGKTQVYIQAAQEALAHNRSVIVLVPEIALTSQIVREFSHYFANVLLTHSNQTEAQRHRIWQAALASNAPTVIIGPRSALFMPLDNVGLIIIDEFHEPAFKQEQSPRYSAIRMASVLAKQHRAKVILGSATPSITDYYLAEQTKRPIIRMQQSARLDTVQPTVELVDMTKRSYFKKHRFLSDSLIIDLQKTFTSNHQALIFHNRRGTASTTLCENCGWYALCPRCFIPYTLHADTHSLQCHICNTSQKVPTHCPTCGSVDIIHKGIGTKLIESELRKLFPNNKIVRFDGDSRANETVDQKYEALYEGEVDLIIGTQVIAKGLDLPHLRTVGVIQADAGLGLPDYGASERTFQLLAQVVGRVGRSHHPTKVVVQSYQPTHPAIRDGLRQDFDHFYPQALRMRQQGNFPPFTYLLQLTCIYKTEAAAIRSAQKLASQLRQALQNIQVLGPTPSFYERQRDTYRWQLLLKSPSRSELQKAINLLPPTHWQFELDPISLL